MKKVSWFNSMLKLAKIFQKMKLFNRFQTVLNSAVLWQLFQAPNQYSRFSNVKLKQYRYTKILSTENSTHFVDTLQLLPTISWETFQFHQFCGQALNSTNFVVTLWIPLISASREGNVHFLRGIRKKFQKQQQHQISSS